MSGAPLDDETTVRQRRVAELITEEMTIILQDEVEDPRIAGAQVTGAHVSRDLRQATIYVAPQCGGAPSYPGNRAYDPANSLLGCGCITAKGMYGTMKSFCPTALGPGQCSGWLYCVTY